MPVLEWTRGRGGGWRARLAEAKRFPPRHAGRLRFRRGPSLRGARSRPGGSAATQGYRSAPPVLGLKTGSEERDRKSKEKRKEKNQDGNAEERRGRSTEQRRSKEVGTVRGKEMGRRR